MFGDIEMNDTATVVAKDDEDEQNSEGCGRQSEKVERHQVLCMIIKKAPPSRRRGCVPRSVEKERRPPLRHQSIISGGNLRVFENLAQTLVAVDAS